VGSMKRPSHCRAVASALAPLFAAVLGCIDSRDSQPPLLLTKSQHVPPAPPSAPSLRVQSPYHCNLLVAGYDKGVGPSLYWMDYLATLHKVNTGGTGYGAWRAAQGKPWSSRASWGPKWRTARGWCGTAGCCSCFALSAGPGCQVLCFW
jgi:hypothetical protein